ncbi:MAG: hypothetical protein Q9198_009542, partial [Flavoplaca austrocitrina]
VWVIEHVAEPAETTITSTISSCFYFNCSLDSSQTGLCLSICWVKLESFLEGVVGANYANDQWKLRIVKESTYQDLLCHEEQHPFDPILLPSQA